MRRWLLALWIVLWLAFVGGLVLVVSLAFDPPQSVPMIVVKDVTVVDGWECWTERNVAMPGGWERLCQRLQEDDPRWDCRTNGNRVCGVRSTARDLVDAEGGE